MLTGNEDTCRASAFTLVSGKMQKLASKARLVVTPGLLEASSSFCTGPLCHQSAANFSIRLLSTYTSHGHQHSAAAPFGHCSACPAWQQPAVVPRTFATRANEQTAGPSAGLLSAVPFAVSRQEADAAFESYHSTDRNMLLSK